MKRGLRNFVLLLCAGVVGWGAGELLCRQSSIRSLIGEALGRGQFLAVVRGRAIHERDLFKGTDGNAETMLAAEVLRRSSQTKPAPADEVAGQIDLLRAQFGDEKAFAHALDIAGLSEPLLRLMVNDHLKVRHWIEDQISSALTVTEEECRKGYDDHRGQFELPLRFRASHIFVAAPEGTDEEMVQAKRSLAQGLSVRLLAGETLADLAAEASEDDATKDEGGDLGYFSAMRMPADFIAELQKLSVGETSSPVRCHLGFHIVALTELKPARQLSFEEARAEIATQLPNKKRVEAVTALTESIRQPEWTRTAFQLR